MREGWRETTVDANCTLIRRGKSPRYVEEGGLRVINQKCIRSENVMDWAPARRTDPIRALPDELLVQIDDVLVCSTGRGTLGRASGIARVDEPSTVDGHVTIVRADGDHLMGSYLSLVLSSQPDRLESLAGGSTNQTELSPASIGSVSFLLPPLREQERIVDLIASLDDTIAKAETVSQRLIAALDQMRDEEMWTAADVVPLSALCEVDGSLVSPTGGNAGLPHVGTERIVGGTGDLAGVVSAEADGVTSGKYRFDESHVIFSKIRPNLRKVAVPSFEGLCSADAYPLLPSEGTPRRYLQQLLLSHPFTELAVARSGRTKMPKINRSELMSILVPLHSEAEKVGWSERFETMEAARSAGFVQLGSLRDLRSNLLTALLSGEHEIPESYDELMEVPA